MIINKKDIIALGLDMNVKLNEQKFINFIQQCPNLRALYFECNEQDPNR